MAVGDTTIEAEVLKDFFKTVGKAKVLFRKEVQKEF